MQGGGRITLDPGESVDTVKGFLMNAAQQTGKEIQIIRSSKKEIVFTLKK